MRKNDLRQRRIPRSAAPPAREPLIPENFRTALTLRRISARGVGLRPGTRTRGNKPARRKQALTDSGGIRVGQKLGARAKGRESCEDVDTPKADVSLRRERIEQNHIRRRRFRSQGIDLVTSSPEAFATLIRKEIPKWRAIVKQSGARVG